MAESTDPIRVHLITGGFPRGSYAGHDIDAVRLELLQVIDASGDATTSLSNDYRDLDDWLPSSSLLVTYVAGPFPTAEECAAIRRWLEAGGRWLALHGTSGGKTVPLPDGRPGRTMVRAEHHELLGCFFLNHPPIRRFRVDVRDDADPIARGLPASFDVEDELYLIELTAPAESQVLLSTSDLPESDPAPREFGFTYDVDTSVEPDGTTRPLAYRRTVGNGAITYVALGHRHTPSTNIQPWVDASIAEDGKTPLRFSGPWQTDAFARLLKNGVEWGLGAGR